MQQRAVCCSNGSTGGADQKTTFPCGHGVPVCEWEEALVCFVESFCLKALLWCLRKGKEEEEQFDTELMFFL
jgi:hypothetical protein